MEKSELLLDEANEKILNKLDNIVGLNKCKDTLREIIKYHEIMREYKCNIEFENYNIIIRNESAYNSYEKLVKVIAEIYYENKIISNSDILYISKDEIRINRVKMEKWEGAKEGLIVLDLSDLGWNSSDIRKSIIQIINTFPTKSFIMIECSYKEGETNAQYFDYFTWAMKINKISPDEKEIYVEKFMKKNNLIYSKNILKKISENSYYKIQSELINILVKSKINKTNNVDYLLQDNQGQKENKKVNKNTGMKELESLIGLEDTKEQIKKIINYIKVCKNRKKLPMLHMVFNGNPGTGKTTVARIIGKIFSEEKILSDKENFVETQRNDLIGEYVGQTAPKTQRVIEKAIGGVLFIDEAYSIASYISDEAGRDYGAECIATLLKGMEDHREELCVILAGYTNEMERMLNVNPGFESRIQFVINFPDYTAEELYMIFKGLCKKEEYKIAPNIKNYLVKYFEVAKKCINFSNARFVRSLFEKIKIEQANRVINEEENKNLIKLEDVLKAISNIKIKKDKVKQKIGF